MFKVIASHYSTIKYGGKKDTPIKEYLVEVKEIKVFRTIEYFYPVSSDY